MGYSKYFLWLLDSGGTVFSNAVLHVTQAVNINELDSALYTLEKKEGDYSFTTLIITCHLDSVLTAASASLI